MSKSRQSPPSAGRDFTQYEFEGNTMGKGRLVLELVKRYASEHPSTTFAELRAAFPDKLQADSPTQFDRIRCVVGRLADVPEKSRRRFFVKTDEKVQLADGIVVVSREWNIHNIRNVLSHAEQLGYRVAIRRRASAPARPSAASKNVAE